MLVSQCGFRREVGGGGVMLFDKSSAPVTRIPGGWLLNRHYTNVSRGRRADNGLGNGWALRTMTKNHKPSD